MCHSSRFVLLALVASGVVEDGLAMGPTRHFITHPVGSDKMVITAKKSALENTISVRGGACPIANDIAKAATGIYAMNAVYHYLAPTKALELYGLPSSPMLEFLMDLCSGSAVAVALMAWCLIIKGTTATFAVGIGAIPVSIGNLKTILNERHKDLGMPSAPFAVWSAVFAISSYLLINDAPSASIIMKLLTAWLLVNGITMAIAPSWTGRTYGFFKEESDDFLITMLRTVGFGTTMHALFAGMLVLGLDATKAFGFALMSPLIQVIYVLTSGEVEKLSLTRAPSYFWLFLLTIFVGTMAL